jgi:adenylate/nucleoside-diphosphate kinase
MPPPEDKVSLFTLQKDDDTMITYMEEALGKVVTRGLREVSENRLKYPGLSVKETMLKLFALFLKTENPANTEHMRNKYHKKMKLFIQRCEMPEEIYDLEKDKSKKLKKGKWLEFKEKYYNDLGAEYDDLIKKVIPLEKQDGFTNFIR